MTDKTPETGGAAQRKGLLLALTLAAVAAFALVIVVIISAGGGMGAGGSDAYRDDLASAMPNADPIIGEKLSAQNDCNACHLVGDGSVAPLFDGLADEAAQRKSDLTAQQYLYEAIVYPSAHLVDGYTDAMPVDYGERLHIEDIGHIIAWLQTFRAES